MIFGRNVDTGKSAGLKLETLVDTRLLIQANSGGGKSYLIRKLLEASHGHVQQIVLDLEGEFGTLREKFPYILIGKGGDRPTDVRTADLLARKLLELGASAIIDLYELKQQDRKRYVRIFLEALVNAPKELWHPVLVVVDEAHQFCPEKEEAESAGAVVDLLTRGRKRGQCGVLATQRLAKLNKDAAAECNNVLIGRTGLDVDMKRASDILGFTSKEQQLSLRLLEPGEFYAFGPALSNTVCKVKVGEVETSHPRAGARSLTAVPPPPPDKIKALLPKLADLPQEAQRELRDRESMLAKIRDLEHQLRVAKSGQNQVDPQQLRTIQDKAFAAGERSARLDVEKQIREIRAASEKHRSALVRIASTASAAVEVEVPVTPAHSHTSVPMHRLPVITRPLAAATPARYHPTGDTDQATLDPGERPPKSGAMQMLKAAAQFHPRPITKDQMATLAGFSVGGGTFGDYFSQLRRRGWIVDQGNDVRITEEGLAAAGDVEPLSTDLQQLVDMWASKFKAGAAKMLRIIASRNGEYITLDELGQESGFSPNGGTFGDYLSQLRRNNLVIKEGDQVRASPTLFLEEVPAV